MFGFSKLQKQLNPAAKDIYLCVMEQSRAPFLYAEWGVPDTMTGRFDCLMLHMFVVLNRLRDFSDMAELRSDDLSQDIFDFCFANMDQALRENGIGDMGVSKRMKKMMLAFNGRMHVYAKAVEGLNAQEADQKGSKDFSDLCDVLMRNLYASADHVDEAQCANMARYIYDQSVHISLLGFDEICAAETLFAQS